MKRTTTVLVLFLIICIADLGCAWRGSPAETAGVVPAEPAEIIIYSFDRQDYENRQDRVLDEIRKRTDTDVRISTGTWDDTQLDILMATGEYPDVLTIVDNEKTGRFNKWVREGKLVPFTEQLIAGFPNLQQLFANPLYEDLKINGQFYGLPLKDEFPPFSAGQHVLMMRKDWLDWLGLPVPETLEQFKQTLIAFKNDDPDRNGFNDTYGLISDGLPGIVRNLIGAWGLPNDVRSTGFLQVGDYYEYWAVQPEVKEALRFVKELYQEKLIQPDTLSAETNVQVRPKFIEGRVGAMFDNMNFDELVKKQKQLRNSFPDAEIIELSALAGPGGKRGYSVGAGFWGYTVITDKAKNPQAIAGLLDFLLSEEGDKLTLYGLPGIHYSEQEEKFGLHREERSKDAGFGPNPGVQHELNWGIVRWTQMTEAPYLKLRDAADPGFSAIVRDNLSRVNRYLIYPASYNIATPKWVSFKANSDELYREYFNRIITGELDLDSGFEKFVNKWMSSGGEEAMREMSDAIKSARP